MCNAYEIGGRSGSFPGSLKAQALSELGEVLERRLIRRTDSAPVVTGDGEVRTMSWGFRRQQLGVVNNSRADNLESSMWRDSYQKRRCLIPVLRYFEWKGPTGGKQTYRFQNSSEDWLWMAGIWEESREYGLCFSMLTTVANRKVLPIHHRMPALLRGSEQERYLKGEDSVFSPREDSLLFEECANPLRKDPANSVQGELF